MRVTSPASDTEHLRYMGLQVYRRVTTGEDFDQPSRHFGFLGCPVLSGKGVSMINFPSTGEDVHSYRANILG